MDLEELCNSCSSRADFVAFLKALKRDAKDNISDWQNQNLHQYFDALATWIEDMDGYYQSLQKPVPVQLDWNLAANILLAAKTYE